MLNFGMYGPITASPMTYSGPQVLKITPKSGQKRPSGPVNGPVIQDGPPAKTHTEDKTTLRKFIFQKWIFNVEIYDFISSFEQIPAFLKESNWVKIGFF